MTEYRFTLNAAEEVLKRLWREASLPGHTRVGDGTCDIRWDGDDLVIDVSDDASEQAKHIVSTAAARPRHVIDDHWLYINHILAVLEGMIDERDETFEIPEGQKGIDTLTNPINLDWWDEDKLGKKPANDELMAAVRASYKADISDLVAVLEEPPGEDRSFKRVREANRTRCQCQAERRVSEVGRKLKRKAAKGDTKATERLAEIDSVVSET